MEETEKTEPSDEGTSPTKGWVFRSAEYGGTLTKTYQDNDLKVEVKVSADTFACAAEIATMCDHIDSWMK